MADFSLIIVAGGTGSRMKADRKKAFITLADEPLLLHTARAFQGVPDIGEVVVVMPAAELAELTGGSEANVSLAKLSGKADVFLLQLADAGVSRVVVGGPRRQDSVLNGLWAAGDKFEFVMIHDAARPFVSHEDLKSLAARTRETGAAILAHPVRDTLKRARPDKVIQETVSRAALWGAQTPQAFRRKPLMDAFNKHNKTDVTDDAEMLALAGGQCSVVQGSSLNFKITTPEDLEIAEALIALRAAKQGDIRPASAIFRKLPGGNTIFDLERPS
ncbi:MAG: 2-C-methyl-D-erythritol 4-phosphate cytidylyltransferase [Planctomycetes bacterium]|nr:2-C-methyl-D-erythritol 4-phosphate cytidylyltransferase [Planctomycetota bacterium]